MGGISAASHGPRKIDKWGTSANTEITARGGGSYYDWGVRGMGWSIIGGAFWLPCRSGARLTPGFAGWAPDRLSEARA
jgi:hypothetical protein